MAYDYTKSETPQRWVSIKDWCTASGVGRTKTYEYAAKGMLRTRKVGRRTLIDLPAGLAWLDTLPAAELRTAKDSDAISDEKLFPVLSSGSPVRQAEEADAASRVWSKEDEAAYLGAYWHKGVATLAAASASRGAALLTPISAQEAEALLRGCQLLRGQTAALRTALDEVMITKVSEEEAAKRMYPYEPRQSEHLTVATAMMAALLQSPEHMHSPHYDVLAEKAWALASALFVQRDAALRAALASRKGK